MVVFMTLHFDWKLSCLFWTFYLQDSCTFNSRLTANCLMIWALSSSEVLGLKKGYSRLNCGGWLLDCLEQVSPLASLILAWQCLWVQAPHLLGASHFRDSLGMSLLCRSPCPTAFAVPGRPSETSEALHLQAYCLEAQR